MRARFIFGFFLAVVVSSMGAIAAGSGVLVVVAQGKDVAARYPTGAMLPSDSTIELADGEKLVVLAGKSTQRFTGPGHFELEEETDAEPPGGFAALVEFLRKPDDGGAGAGTVLGAVRGGSVERASAPWLVDVTTNGVDCVQSGKVPTLWRGADTPATRASIEAMSSGQRSFFDWPEGQKTIAWPSALPILDGEHYLVDLSGATQREIVVHVLAEPAAQTGAALLRLVELGCTDQARRLLGTISED